MALWQALLGYWKRLFARRPGRAAPGSPRMTGDPTSANRASSMHLWWSLPYGELLTEVSATVEIVEPPVVERLYFWALQAAFVKPDGGAAHLGIQYNDRHPGFRAVNFGGYAPRDIGGLLDGEDSILPSTPSDPNTRDYDWLPGRRYRLSIKRVPFDTQEGFHAWRGSIEEVDTGKFTIVRVLFSRGEYLRGPVVWTESFARCESPSVSAKWTDLEAVGDRHGLMAVTSGSVNYQHRDAGGCDNTNMFVEGNGWVQQTNTMRTVPTGTVLSIE